MAEQLIDLQSILEKEKKNTKLFDFSTEKELDQINAKLNTQKDDAFAQINNKWLTVLTNVEEEVFNQNTEISLNSKEYDERTNELELQVVQDLQQIQDIFDVENKERTESSEVLVNQLMSEFDATENKLQVEIREETNNKIYQMIEGFYDNLKTEIQQETIDREENQKTLLQLLDDTCAKIDQSFS